METPWQLDLISEYTTASFMQKDVTKVTKAVWIHLKEVYYKHHLYTQTN